MEEGIEYSKTPMAMGAGEARQQKNSGIKKSDEDLAYENKRMQALDEELGTFTLEERSRRGRGRTKTTLVQTRTNERRALAYPALIRHWLVLKVMVALIAVVLAMQMDSESKIVDGHDTDVFKMIQENVSVSSTPCQRLW